MSRCSSFLTVKTMNDSNSKAVKNLLQSIEGDIDQFYQEDGQTEHDAVYFLEQLNTRIMSTIFSREEKIEFMAIAGSLFHAKGIAHWKGRLPGSLWERVLFVFKKGKLWPLI